MVDLGETARRLDDLEGISSRNNSIQTNHSSSEEYMSNTDLYVVLKDLGTELWRILKRYDAKDINNLSMDNFGSMNKWVQQLRLNLVKSDNSVDGIRLSHLDETMANLSYSIGEIKNRINNYEEVSPIELTSTLFPFFVGINDITEAEMIHALFNDEILTKPKFDNISDRIGRSLDKLYEKGKYTTNRWKTNHYTYHMLQGLQRVDVSNPDSILEGHYKIMPDIRKNIDVYNYSINHILQKRGGDHLKAASYPYILGTAVKILRDRNGESSKFIV